MHWTKRFWKESSKVKMKRPDAREEKANKQIEERALLHSAVGRFVLSVASLEPSGFWRHPPRNTSCIMIVVGSSHRTSRQRRDF